MILGFRANINNDSHRIFLNRLSNIGVNLNTEKGKDGNGNYSFIFKTVDDFDKAQEVKKTMSEFYEDIPLAI